MSIWGQQFANRGCTIVADYTHSNGHTVVFAGTKAVLSAFDLGNREAWQRLIADNEPEADGLLYVYFCDGKRGGTVRIRTRQQARRLAGER